LITHSIDILLTFGFYYTVIRTLYYSALKID